ncbi:transposase [Streptomyces griseoviridis]|uniref:transposase n=1 Tax=Streptomyces griseoviridis TaxID=45398 RepID=UPI003405A749
MRALWTARRHQALNAEIGPLVKQAAPALPELFGIGPETADQLLASAGDNSERMWSERAFAHLAGIARIPASSGRTHRHRLNRGGDRTANNGCTPSCWSGCASTNAPAPTSNAAPRKGCPRRASCAASSDLSPARSTAP